MTVVLHKGGGGCGGAKSVMLTNLLALFGVVLGSISAVEEFPVKELNTNHSKDEQEEDVDDEDIEHIFERGNNAIKHSLESGNTVNHLERTQDTQQFDRFQFLARWSPPAKHYSM